MDTEATQNFNERNPDPEVLPPTNGSTSVEFTAHIDQSSIEPAFRLSVNADQSPIPQPQQLSADRHSSADVDTPLGKSKKKGVQGPRLRKACDACSKRKVKCDEQGPPCKACATLSIPCTFSRPSRRRGPRNRHADAIKDQLLNPTLDHHHGSGPASPTYAAQTLASLAQQPVLSADSICPPQLLERFVDDYFKYVHPLVPVPHEPSFRAGLAAREDLNNPNFLALLASMIGCLVASFPRRPRQHIQDLRMEGLFPNSNALIERCRRTAIEARGMTYLDRQQTVDDAIIAYLQGLIGAYSFNWDACRLYMGQCVTISRVVGLHRRGGPGIDVDEGLGHQQGGDAILQEMYKRVFWIVFSTVSSLQQLGVSARELSIPPPTALEPYPEFPMEIDDAYITPQGAHPMPEGEISRLAGFNANMKIYQACTGVSVMDLAYGINELFDWNRQNLTLRQSLSSVEDVLSHAPPEFSLQHKSAPLHDQRYPPPNQGYPEMFAPERESAHDRRKVQLEIQKANLHAAQLATRSFLIDKYSILFEAHYGSTRGSTDVIMENGSSDEKTSPNKDEMTGKRDILIKDLLKLLQSLDLTYLEPCGLGFTNKIRQVASTLINTPPHRKSAFHKGAEQYLMRLVDFLTNTQRVGPGVLPPPLEAGGGVDEEEEVRAKQWGELLQPMGGFGV
ncbi:MAG: hypothetical protein Q9220_002141 [cf. Caloplaca sp. 1 TL-2023]